MKILFVLLLIFLSACAIDHPSPISGVPRSGTGMSFFENATTTMPDEIVPTSVPLLYWVENFTPAIYESEGTSLGIWLDPDISKRNFLQQAGRNHAVFVYEMHACGEIPVNWILQCIASLATPLIIIHPPISDYAIETEWIMYLAYRFGTFNLPMFVAFYPDVPQGMDYTTQEFAAIYRFARSMFSLHAPLASFVWVAPALNSTTRNPFFPGHDVVDWVGISLLLPAEETDDTLEQFEAFYHRFADHHPIMILPLGVSHFSRDSGGYRIPQAASDIAEIYRTLLSFPRVGLIVYGDAFGIAKTGSEDFSISIEPALLDAYRETVSLEGFTSAIEKSPQGTGRYRRDLLNAYIYNGQIYIDTETLQNLNIPLPGGVSEINGREYINASRLSGFGIRYCEELNVVFFNP